MGSPSAPVNPADKVERPKKEHFVGSFYDADEMNALFAASKGSKLEIPILFGAFYGLRRSEAIGLKWDAIDFEHDTLTCLLYTSNEQLPEFFITCFHVFHLSTVC